MSIADPEYPVSGAPAEDADDVTTHPYDEADEVPGDADSPVAPTPDRSTESPAPGTIDQPIPMTDGDLAAGQ
jgi:hypothetical protein